MIIARMSALPRALICPASLRMDGERIETPDPAGKLGTAVHDVLAVLAASAREGEPLPAALPSWVDSRLLARSCPSERIEEARILIYRGIQALQAILPANKIIGVEQEVELKVEEWHFTGHLDLMLQAEDGSLTVVDWKTGCQDLTDPEPQLRAYLRASTQGHGTTIIVWLRDQEMERRTYSAEEQDSWWKSVLSTLRSGIYSPGQHCRHCLIQVSCAARQSMLSEAVRMLSGDASLVLKEQAPPAQVLANLYPQRQLLQQALERYDELLLAAAREAGGELRLSSGDQIVLQRREIEKIKSCPEALSEIQALLNYPDLGTLIRDLAQVGAIALVKGKILDALKAGAPRGRARAIVEEAERTLREKGLLARSVQEFVAFKKRKERK